MAIFESIFDILYLSLVIGLGVRLLLEKDKGARIFGLMAILLGAGDATHLLPRIISHLSPMGFEGHEFALSWGQFITSITMTVFYLLYFYYYRAESEDRDRKKLLIVYLLAGFRIALVFFPQNLWGQVPGDYLFGIYRNIPFAILGVFLIIWSYRARAKGGLRYMWLLISLSFIFYIPVVLWSTKYPVVGTLMMPKTIAYLLIVVLGYRHFVGKFSRLNLLGIAFINLIMGLIAGVFYREFTKFYSFEGPNHLGKLHVHLLVLGFALTLILYLISIRYDKIVVERFKKPIYTYMSGLSLTTVSMVVIGIYEIVAGGQETINMAAMNGISGLSHIILTTGLVWIFVEIYRAEKTMISKNQQVAL